MVCVLGAFKASYYFPHLLQFLKVLVLNGFHLFRPEESKEREKKKSVIFGVL